jgi:hypothetical protein
MDNEPGVWPANHRPIMPVGQTMEQMRDRIIAYATAVKAVDPNAKVIGSEEWGWTNYIKSPYDTYTGGNTDRNAHGNMDYQAWLLQALKANNDATGKRLLDVFSLHYYPQYSEFSQGDSSTAAQLKRNESTRDLWDPNYVSSSWIANTIKLIPRMKGWVNTYYPGTKIAITEYSWGAESHISGGITEADILGIFGREGVDIATFWGGIGSGNQPIRNAFKMYRNYDGKKSTFGDTSVSATVANPDNLAAFAAQRSTDNALTVMVVCKYLSANTPVTVSLANFAAESKAQVWQFTSANTINHLADATVSNGTISFNAPAQSVTLFVIPRTIANGTYKLVARHSGKAMEAASWGTANGTQIQQWAYNGGNNQRWILTDRGNKQYSIIGVQSGKAIDIDGWKTADGTKVQLWDYSGGNNQRFTFTQTSAGYYRITPVHASASCLDVAGYSSADGAVVHLWTFGGGQNQEWSVQNP